MYHNWENENTNKNVSLYPNPEPLFKASPATSTSSPESQVVLGSHFAPKFRSVYQPSPEPLSTSSVGSPFALGNLNGEVFSMKKSGTSFNQSLESNVSKLKGKSESSHIEAPVFDGPINWKRSFRSNSNPSTVIDEIKKYCHKHRILDVFVSEENFEIEGRLFSSKHEMAEFIIRFFNLADQFPSPPQTLVQITCLSGCRITFLHFVQQLLLDLDERRVVAYTEISKKPNTFSETFQLPPLEMEELFDVNYFEEIIQMIERGHREECRTGASCLVNKTEELKAIEQLEKIPNLVQRLMTACSESFDVFLVRSILITLINGSKCSKIIGNEIENVKIKNVLRNLKDRWSSTQKAFGIIEIRKSDEIVTHLNALI